MTEITRALARYVVGSRLADVPQAVRREAPDGGAADMELRQAVAQYVERLYSLRYDPVEQILVTVGVSEAMFIAAFRGYGDRRSGARPGTSPRGR